MKNIVIVDIDGTISRIGDRVKYIQGDRKDWNKFYDACFDDEPIVEMIHMIKRLINSDHIPHVPAYEVIFCTGRRECVRKKTYKWLKKHFGGYIIPTYALLMRKSDDYRSDTIVKPELVKEAGIDFEDIAFVIEDRDKMVKQWRELGVICIQPFPGDF